MHPTSDDSARDCRLEEILHAYLQAVGSGQPPDRGTVVRAHPEFALEQAAFFADQDAVAQLAQGMANSAALRAGEAPTLAPPEAPVPAPGMQVRYFGDYEWRRNIARDAGHPARPSASDKHSVTSRGDASNRKPGPRGNLETWKPHFAGIHLKRGARCGDCCLLVRGVGVGRCVTIIGVLQGAM
jgi:hypothetical protein